MSQAPTARIKLKHDQTTNSMRIQLLDSIVGVTTEEVIRRLGSSCRASRICKKIGGIEPLLSDGGIACRVQLREPLENYDELHMRDALKEAGFLCV